MESNQYAEEQQLLHELEERDSKAFMRLMKEYNDDLMIFAYARLKDRQKAEDSVQELFEALWEAGHFMEIKPPIYKFLVEELNRICERKMSH